MVIGLRMRQARLAAGLTLDEVVELLGGSITKAGLSKYELSKSTPTAAFLARLAPALGVRASQFIEEPSVSVIWVAFRKHSRLPVREQARIQAFAERRFELDLWLRSVLCPAQRPQTVPRLNVTTPSQAELAAEQVRVSWKLGQGPIPAVTTLLEDRGAVVVAVAEPREFDGLSAWINEHIPAFVVNASMPPDRRRYDLAHELGHLVTKNRLHDAKAEETLAHRFAAAFLVPADSARTELGAHRRTLDVQELGLLKRKWGMSMQAWIRRARDLEIIGPGQYQTLNVVFRSRGWHRSEPVPFEGEEEPKRFRLLAHRALAEGVVSEGWAEAACPEAVPPKTGVEEPMYESLRLARLATHERHSILADAADAVAADYATDAEFADWETADLDGAADDAAG